MKSMIFVAAALVAFADALPEWAPSRIGARQVAQRPVESPKLGTPTVQGCFKSPGKLKLQGIQGYSSMDKCGMNTCQKAGFAVGAAMGGNECWCGDKYPAKEDLVDPKNCNVTCTGYGEACGGIEFWTVYNSGLTVVVKHEPDTRTTTTTSSTPSATSSTAVGSTQTTSETPTNEPESDSGGSTNVGGIVAGVVVGVVVIASIIGGGYMYMRRKRNKEIEEEHRRNAAVNAFIGKPPGSSAGSMTDSRLDPVLAHRRMSDGSIADNQDYSRKILRVTNA